MARKIWQIDAFADQALEGNPAALVPLEHWLDDALMQKIAEENNLSETAFFVQTGPGHYALRWFTPTTEVDLCGHATLASAWLLLNRLEPGLNEVRFMTRSGELVVGRDTQNRLAMSLPSASSEPFSPPDGFSGRLASSLNASPPMELHYASKGGAGAGSLMAVWPSRAAVEALQPNGGLEAILQAVKAGSLIATAAGDGKPYDFVSRFFAPAMGVPEDPVTGSAHCVLAPFWARRRGKKKLHARQVSRRAGDLICTDDGDRVLLAGRCALYLQGEIEV